MNELEGTVQRGLAIFRGKEGWIKALWAFAILGGAGLAISLWFLPYVIDALDNINLTLVGLWHALFLLVPLVLLMVLALNSNIQQLVVYGVDNAALAARNAVLDRTPRLTAENALKRLWKRIQRIKAAAIKVRGAGDIAEKGINQFYETAENAREMSSAAMQEGDADQAERWAMTAQSAEEAIKRQQPNLKRDRELEALLMKLAKRTQAKYEANKDRLQMLISENEIESTSASAVREGREAADGADTEIFERQADNLARQTAELAAEVDLFMEDAKPLFAGDALADRVKRERAMKKVQEWMTRDSKAFPKAERQQLLLEAGSPTQFIPAETVSQVRSSGADKYSLIDRK